MQNEVDQVRDEVLNLFPWLEAELGDDLAEDGHRVLRRARSALANSRYLVLVVGEFKLGKSSLLNALIGQRLFPEDTDIATATVCTLCWGESPQAVVHFLQAEDGPQLPAKAIALDEVPRYATVQGQRAEGGPEVVRIDMTAPIPQLRSGLTLVDTPGVGSMNPAHTAATSGFLPEADAMLFVASSVEPLGTVELSFLARAYDVCPIVLTVLSMIDKSLDESAVLADDLTRIAGATGMAADDVDIVAVSSLRKWNGEAAGDQDLIKASGFPELELKLWTGLVASCAIARLGQAVDVLQVIAGDSGAPLRTEQSALAGGEQLAQLDEELTHAQARAVEARAEAPRRSRKLSQELTERARPITRRLKQSFDNIIADFTADTNHREVLAEPAPAINRLVRRMVEVQADANRALNVVIDDVAARFSADLPKALAGLGGEAITAADPITAPSVELPKKRFSTFRMTWTGGTAGGAAGLLLGVGASLVFPPAAMAIGVFVAGPLVGGVLGQLLGMVGGYRQATQQNQEQQDARVQKRLREAVIPKIRATAETSLEDMRQRVEDETRALTAALDEQLTREARQLEEKRETLRRVRARTAAENAARVREVAARLQKYGEIDRALMRARIKVEALGGDEERG
ncbi:MAG TPA: dynamin family protein [Trebonia sp.]|jgi:hypothetical protein|nr:dynamin family protein [Trebonia sp.]